MLRFLSRRGLALAANQPPGYGAGAGRSRVRPGLDALAVDQFHADAPGAEGDQADHEIPEEGNPEERGGPERAARVERGPEETLLDLRLDGLDDDGRPVPLALDRGEVLEAHPVPEEGPGQAVRRHHGVLDGVVDPDPADRRHDVRGVADQEQPRLVPAFQAARFDGQGGDLIPVDEGLDSLGELGHQLHQRGAERLQAPGAEVLVSVLGDHVAHLPVVGAFQPDEEPAGTDAEADLGVVRILGGPGEAEPEHVHRRRGLHRLEAGQGSDAREPAVAGDRQRGPHLVPAFVRLVADPLDAPVVLDEFLDVGPHHQPERGISSRLGGHEFEEIDLGDQRDVGELRVEVAEIGERERSRGGLDRPPADLRVAKLEQAVGQAERVEDFQRAGMDRVAPEFAVEVLVGFQEPDLDPLTRQEVGEHQPRGTAADDAATGLVDVEDFVRRARRFGRGHGRPLSRPARRA